MHDHLALEDGEVAGLVKERGRDMIDSGVVQYQNRSTLGLEFPPRLVNDL